MTSKGHDFGSGMSNKRKRETLFLDFRCSLLGTFSGPLHASDAFMRETALRINVALSLKSFFLVSFYICSHFVSAREKLFPIFQNGPSCVVERRRKNGHIKIARQCRIAFCHTSKSVYHFLVSLSLVSVVVFSDAFRNHSSVIVSH